MAICFLHAYRNPENEKLVAAALQGLGYLCCSHDVCPEFREFERTSTTLINAYVGPLMDRYLGELERGTRHAISIMQSNGGFMTTKEARRHAIRTVLSGPAGGVVGALETARLSGFTRILGFRHGRHLHRCQPVGRPAARDNGGRDRRLSGACPYVGYPHRGRGRRVHRAYRRRRVAAGWTRERGRRSGPACYGTGERPTVTDAHVVLGRIAADQLVGGEMHLDVERAGAAVDSIANAAGITRVAAAEGILRVANANMERAIRLVSVERGHDPRDFALVAFGGCGGLHACEIARELGIRTVLVPEYAGALVGAGNAAGR